ncbi:MAG: hypothetical protein KF760_22295 [Candidatus Eremiobacteraeota bacterium]|nr:hypothetical protein [Candidatus Eremiobacteraeota bacterium]MCW5866443.1 hypothetical protein [Candidatus Eremiobacteraeota bacterium]
MSWREEDNPLSGGLRNPGLVAPLLDLALHMQAGHLTPAEYLERIQKAQGRFQRLRGRMAESILAGTNLEAYREGLMEALDDTFNLLQYGLEELQVYRVGENRAPLRMGRLLLEKGEQEYLALLEIIQKEADVPGCERERTTDLWSQLLHEAGRARLGEITPEDYLETLAWGEWALRAHMDGTFRDFQRALNSLRASPDQPTEAEQKVLVSLHRLREFLGLSV